MKTSYLNPEIYSRISDPAVNKDKTAQRKQRQTVKATIPLMKTIVSVKEVETEIKKKVSPDTFEKLNLFYHNYINHLGYLMPLLLTYKGNVKGMYAQA